jgi:hypothetical protein
MDVETLKRYERELSAHPPKYVGLALRSDGRRFTMKETRAPEGVLLAQSGDRIFIGVTETPGDTAFFEVPEAEFDALMEALRRFLRRS